MKICSRCCQPAEDSVHFCENCGAPLASGSENASPDALPAGVTLFGRYVTGQVLRQDDSSFTYLAQDSRTKGPVAVREFFLRNSSRRTSMSTVTVPEEEREAFLEGKERFLEEAADLSDRYDSGQPPCVQCYFNQNDTAYLVVDYGTPENLRRFLNGEDFQVDIPADIPALGSGAQQAGQQQAVPSDIPAAGSGIQQVGQQQAKVFPESGSGGTADRIPGTASGETSGGISAGKSAASTAAEHSAPVSDMTKAESVPAGGSKKSVLVPVLILFAFFLAALITLVVLLLRILSGIPRTGRYLNPFFRQFYHPVTEEKNNPEDNPEGSETQSPQDLIRDILSGKSDWKITDLTDAENGETGISSGNFYNQGFYLLYDGDCYFSNPHGLFRAGSPEDLEDLEYCEKIASGGIRYLNEYEGYIYFLNEADRMIHRLDPYDDTVENIYSSAAEPEYAPETLFIYDGWCYFSHKRNLYRFDLEETGEDEPLVPEDVEPVVDDFNYPGKMYASLCPVKGRLVYNGMYGITAVDPDGGNAESISDQEGNLISDGNDIYCFFGVTEIYRISMDGESELIVDADVSEPLTKFNCAGGYLYYTAETEDQIELYRLSTEGNGTEEFLGFAGVDGDILISLCAFPDAEEVYIYKLSKQEEKLTPGHECIPVE